MANGDIYKGEIVDDSIMKGLGIYIKKNKLIMIGTINEGSFGGPAVCFDIQEKSIYHGQLRDNMK